MADYAVLKECRAENRILVSNVCDKAKICEKRHISMFTDFLSPSEMEDVLKASHYFRDIRFKSFGGNENCERRLGCFFYEYDEPSEFEFPIKALKITSNIKFSSQVSHRDYLGSLLGLGIDRSKTGDIFVFDGSAIMFIKAEIADYVSINLEHVGRNAVKTEVCEIGEIVFPEIRTDQKNVTVSSLRADTVVGAAFNLARGKSQGLIEGEKVFVNGLPVLSASKILSEGDIISVRGFGRAKIKEVNGLTKKGRISVLIEKYI